MNEIVQATTETGSIYVVDFDNMFWWKIKNGRLISSTERIWDIKLIAAEMFHKWAASNIDWKQLREVKQCTKLIPGKSLYISSRDMFYITTPIETVETIDGEEFRQRFIR